MKMQLSVSLLLLGSLSKSYAAESRLKMTHYSPVQRSSNLELNAREFLDRRASQLGVPVKNLELLHQQSSLAAEHFTFQQVIDGVPIENATVAVSVSNRDGSIFQYFDGSLKDVAIPREKKARISLDKAYDAAWAYVGVQDRLFQAPNARLQYLADAKGKGVRLVYHVELSPTNPYGAFGIDVDAHTGEIVQARDLRVMEKVVPLPKTFGSKRPTINRAAAFSAFAKRNVAIERKAGVAKDGSAMVFDPDPKTFLGSTTLKDSSPAADFEAAYLERELSDLNFDGTNYSLLGPWVKIIDFDPPTARPTTTTDGKWNFKRGANGFTDAMTYYHLDQSQRYMQSLGFKDTKGIQFGPIEVDADGVNGSDNSYFQSSSNRLSFGHGCVDDNEDADVILHEYGHAINWSINRQWGGGDSGAMGEGFGDYWAASHSYSTESGNKNGIDFVFNWDASAGCWDGRILNASAARYDHSRTYGAHSSIAGGFQSDELWATPLFQAHKNLRALGVPREEIDSIVLEAQFGLGSGLKMRDMATAIVATARRLYENGPHADAFLDQFVHHGILLIPRPNLTANLGDISDDGILDPGESVTIPLKIKNSGDLVADAISVSVASDDIYVTEILANFDPFALAPGKETSLNLGVTVSDNTPCGHVVPLVATLKDKAGKVWSVNLNVQVGRALKTQVASVVNTAIPDRDSNGIKNVIEIASTAKVSSTFNVNVNVSHTYRADLRIILTAPSGKSVILHDRSGYSEDNIVGNYPLTLTPKEPLTGLVGQELNGVWTLKVSDEASSDKGTFNSWGIEDISGYECR